jgi:hypothetical protein
LWTESLKGPEVTGEEEGGGGRRRRRRRRKRGAQHSAGSRGTVDELRDDADEWMMMRRFNPLLQIVTDGRRDGSSPP